MSVPAYENYRDSKVEWLGQVPSHWRLDRLKASIVDCRNGVWGEEADGSEDDVLCVRVADFDRTSLRVSLVAPTFRRVTRKERADRLVCAGDLLIEKSGGGEKQPVGAVVIFSHDVPAVCSNFVGRMRLAAGMIPAYWLYVHSAAYAVRLTARSINQTSGIQNLDQWRYFEERAPFPPAAEQAAIASFLDRETAKIDALVEEQRRLIDLLNEKRQAAISHAVTKGLDSSVAMKDSGVEWLGEVPAHWEVRPIKSYVTLAGRIGYRGYTTADIVEEGEGAITLSPSNLRSGEISLERSTYISWDKFHESPEIQIEPNDVVLVKTGSTYGKVGAFRSSEIPPATINPQLLLLKNSKLASRYLFYSLVSESVAARISVANTGGTIPTITQEFVGNITVAAPGTSEQADIVSFLDEQTAKIDELARQAEMGIALLQERRSALISAAVTGKIDVRGLVGGEAEAA